MNMAKNQVEWQIHFYEDHCGRSPVLEFINRLPIGDRTKINNALRLLEEFGVQLGMPHARPIEGKLWELRPGGNRLFYFLFTGRKFVILHGFKKQTMKTPDWEFEIAKRRMVELLEDER
jgi:phage-related protein